MPNFDRQRQVWHDHIARWGGGVDNGRIVRGGTPRSATMAIAQFEPRERDLFVDGAIRMMISALNVATGDEPNPELDHVEFKGVKYKILMLPRNPMPDGTWIAFDTPCVKSGTAEEVS